MQAVLMSVGTGFLLAAIFGGAAETEQVETQGTPLPANSKAGSGTDIPTVNILPTQRDFSVNISLNGSYTGAGDAEFRDAERGSSDAYALSWAVNARLPINAQWFVPLGLSGENFFLESVIGTPIPDQINTLRLAGGVGYRPNEQWSVSATLGPTVYNLQDIDSNDIGMAGALLATYRYSPELAFSGGVLFSSDSDIPAFPALGLTWKFHPQYTLELIMPQPRLVYAVGPGWNLYVGGEMKAATFRTRNQTDMPQFNAAIASYRDFRLGIGTEWRVAGALIVEADLGYSVYRYLDYHRLDEEIEFEAAPYVRAGLRYRF